MQHPQQPLRALALAALAAALLPACRVESNGDASLGSGDIRLAAFDSGAAAHLSRERTLGPGKPEPLPLDRSDWRVTRVEIPLDGTAHYHTLATNTHLAFAARERGEFPSLIEATRRSDRRIHQQVAEAGFVAGVSAADALLLLPRALILSPLWTTTRDRDHDFARTRSEGWLARSRSPYAPADAPAPGYPPPSVVKRFPIETIQSPAPDAAPPPADTPAAPTSDGAGS